MQLHFEEAMIPPPGTLAPQTPPVCHLNAEITLASSVSLNAARPQKGRSDAR